MKAILTLAASATILSGLAVSASPATAAPKEKVTICHATGSETNPYNVITVSGNALKNGHTGDKGDIIPATPECIALDKTPEPEDETGPEAPEEGTGSSQVITYDCTATYPVRIITTTKGKSAPVVVTEFLNELEVLEICKPVPGDRPVTPSEPVAPVVEDSLEGYPAPPPAAEDLVLDNTAPVDAAPLANLGSVEQAPAAPDKPTQLANTGWEETLAILGGLALVGGTILIGLRRKLLA